MSDVISDNQYSEIFYFSRNNNETSRRGHHNEGYEGSDEEKYPVQECIQFYFANIVLLRNQVHQNVLALNLQSMKLNI